MLDGSLFALSTYRLMRSPVPRAAKEPRSGPHRGQVRSMWEWACELDSSQAPGSRLLTTQLYFPNEPANLRDFLFQSELLMRVADTGDDLDGRFDFVLDVR